MGDVVELHPADLRDNHEFITDLARFSEGLVSEAAIKKRYYFTDEIWSKLGDDDGLIRAVEDEKLRRIRSGATKRERAQALVIEAPQVLDAIMRDPGNSPRHRIDAAKGLDDFSGNGAEAAAVADRDRFVITINLGEDTLKFDRSITISPNDVDPNDPSTTPAMVAAKKRGGPKKIQPEDDADGPV